MERKLKIQSHHRKLGTKTSAFGSPGRINHDSSKFYNSKLYEGLNNGKDVKYVELPYRIIQLYTFEGEVVLDPFAGSGSACIAALKTNRKYIAYDIDKKYCALTEQRIKQFLQEQITLFK